MTFYWWSHWFWITLLYNICMSGKLANTFPSQEISSTEGNHNDKTNRAVTKLYQTTATFAWSTSVSPYAIERTVLTSVSPKLGGVLEEQENSDANAPLTDYVQDEPAGDSEYADSVEMDDGEFTTEGTDQLAMSSASEFKRSVEAIDNATQNEPVATVDKNSQADALDKTYHADDALSNYTNFSSQQSTNLTNNHNATTLNSQQSNATAADESALAATPSTPKITNIDNNSDTLQSITHLPLPQQSHLTTLGDVTVNAESDNDNDIKRAPFTLENVNKEDALRRAENEHRTRKPKVLSAEYKQINRVINYSTDSKSLLTRSASTAPNIFDSDDDNIIASEALSVQRTYFLDPSAISAICLTVFGVCCTVGTIGLVLYRRRYLNKPQTLSEPDSSVYIDDSTMRVSDNSDEMYSLDNDSFLNSLEAMTIQNYWTDTVKHTKL